MDVHRRNRGAMEFHIFLSMTLLLATFAFTQSLAQGTSVCPGKEVWYGESYYCCDFECLPGTYPVQCDEGSPESAECVMCPHHTFRKDSGRLVNQDICSRKRNCYQEGMQYISPGNQTHDAVCDCIPGFRKLDKSDNEDFTCVREEKSGAGVKNVENNRTGHEAEEHGASTQFPGFAIVIIAMAIGIALMFTFWFWTPCNSCSRVDEGLDDEENMLGSEEKKKENSEGCMLGPEEKKKVIEFLLYRYLPTKLSKDDAGRVIDHLFRDYADDKNLPESAKCELSCATSSENGLRDRIAEAFKLWYVWRSNDATCHEIFDALRGIDFDCESAKRKILDELNINL